MDIRYSTHIFGKWNCKRSQKTSHQLRLQHMIEPMCKLLQRNQQHRSKITY